MSDWHGDMPTMSDYNADAVRSLKRRVADLERRLELLDELVSDIAVILTGSTPASGQSLTRR